MSAIAKTAALCGDELAIYSGNDDQILPLLALGGIGVISVLANVAPRGKRTISAGFISRANTRKALRCSFGFWN